VSALIGFVAAIPVLGFSAATECSNVLDFLDATAVSPFTADLLTALPCRAPRVWSSGSVVLFLLPFPFVTGMAGSGFCAAFFRFSLLDLVAVGTGLVETVVGVP